MIQLRLKTFSIFAQTYFLLKLKFQYFDHLMLRADSLEKTLMLGKTEGKKERRHQRMTWLDSITNSTDVNLSKLLEIEEAWHVAVHGVTKSQTWLSDWITSAALLDLWHLKNTLHFMSSVFCLCVCFFQISRLSTGDITFESQIWRLKYREAKSVAQESQRDLTDGWSLEGMLLLLLSRFSRVRLCETKEMAAHQALLSLGFSR